MYVCSCVRLRVMKFNHQLRKLMLGLRVEG
jgi:hypothetical protein